MRVLITLCLVAFASAQNGYNYQPVESAAPVQTGYAAPVAASQPVEQAHQAPAELVKEFFTYNADERDFHEPTNTDQLSQNLRQALRVIFIKGPEYNGLEDAAVALSKQSGEQHTAIYVLNKQADIGDLANKLNSIRGNNNNKPEVHFVKYRTPEDAANAQRTIQDQYDQLGGVSSHQNGGVAPVLNFASQPAAHAQPAAQEPLNSYLPASVLRRRL